MWKTLTYCGLVFLGHLFLKKKLFSIILCKLLKCFFINGNQRFTFPSLPLYIQISCKYQSLVFRTDLGLAYWLLTVYMHERIFCCCVLYSYNSTYEFSKLLKMFNISWRFFTLFLATSILYCFTVNIHNSIICHHFLLPHLFQMDVDFKYFKVLLLI